MATSIVERYAYDLLDREIRYTDGEGAVTTRQYDLNGRISNIVPPNEHAKTAKNAALAVKGYSYTYDLDDRLLEVVGTDNTLLVRNSYDAQGNRHSIEYNMYESPVSRVIRGNETNADESDKGTHLVSATINEAYTYDKLGRLSCAISDGKRYDYTYDKVGRILEKSSGGRTLVRYGYDANGNRISLTDVTGKKTLYDYDVLDQLVKVSDALGEFAAQYEYMPDGQLKSVTSPVMQSIYEYDLDGR